ncbi:MAG: ATP-grasp domain-containing protein [Flavobacteriaceae bacterium]|nr:ATP-grasp domain-containing protein [Flavobacteriaceae bacterium]
MKNKIFYTKLTKWEHWPTYMFYVPLIPYYIYKAIRARNLVFYLAANPAIKYSGNGTESKFKTIQLIPQEFRPKTVLVPALQAFEITTKQIALSEIKYPLIAKPDVGFRGYLVKKINSEKDLHDYLKRNDIDIIIQEFIDYKNECGILYARVPNQTEGEITSITLKKFLTIKGDGRSTLSELITNDNRAYLYFDLLKNIHKDAMNTIVKKDEEKVLTVIGNHSKGTQFLNGNHLISKELITTIDAINKKIDGWYYGRLDIKYDTFEKLKQGKDFKIIEINGIISEPTHIYDSQGATYFDALKTIKSHWKKMNKIARINHDLFNVSYPKIIPYLKEIFWLRKYSKKIINLNKVN